MKKLTFTQKSILVLYREFFEKNYVCCDLSHIGIQNAIYVLQEKGVYPGQEYEFSWNGNYGPYSADLEGQLKALDLNSEIVKRFYYNYNEFGDQIIKYIYTEEQIKKLDECTTLIEIINHYKKFEEVFGGLLFIGKTVFPSSDFSIVNNELKRRKPHLNDDKINFVIWECLIYLGLIKNVNNNLNMTRRLEKK